MNQHDGQMPASKNERAATAIDRAHARAQAAPATQGTQPNCPPLPPGVYEIDCFPGDSRKVFMTLEHFLASQRRGNDLREQVDALNHELGEKFEHIAALEGALHDAEIREKERGGHEEELIRRIISAEQLAKKRLHDTEHFRRAFEEASQERHELQKEVSLYREANRLVPEPQTFREVIQSAINRFSKESGSDTPDFILAAFVCNVLGSFDTALKARTKWYSPKDAGSVDEAPAIPPPLHGPCTCVRCIAVAAKSDVFG